MTKVNLAFDAGAHACHLFESFSEQKEVVLPFFKQGLLNGEHCLYVTSVQPVDDWYFELQAYGIDVRAERARGALNVITGAEFASSSRGFNSVVKAREAVGMIQGLLADFSAVRIAGDAGWALDLALPVDQLCHWEATANLIYEGERVRAICQYDLKRHPAASVHAALRTHPIAISAGRSRWNPYCEAQRILAHEPDLNHSNADERMIDEMLVNLRRQPEVS